MNRFNQENNIKIGKNSSMTLVIVSITMLMLFQFTSSESYAETAGTFEWQLLFIQDAKCLPKDNLHEVYSSLTTKYFEMYKLENLMRDPLCMTELEYSDYQMDENIDFLILIYDNKVGEKILEPNKVDGLYIHTGDDRTKNHLMIMCHCSGFDSSYDQILPSWILSHELSHFVLSFKGFPQSVVENAVHEIEHEYDNCVGSNFQNDYCEDFKITVSPDFSSKDFPMMKPYEPAVGQKLIKYIPEDFSNSEITVLQRNIAKMWITNEIDDHAYVNTLKNFVGIQKTDFGNEEHVPFLKIENGFVIAEISKPEEIKWDEYLDSEDKTGDHTQLIVDQIPLNLDDSVSEFNMKEMPNWFKTRALLWSEQKISDKVFFDGVEHLIRTGIISFK